MIGSRRTRTDLTKDVLRSNTFSLVNSSSTCSGKVSPSLASILARITALIFWEDIERGRCSRVNRFGGVLKERIYIM